MKKYIDNLGVIISQFVNTILGGAPDEMLSTRIARNKTHFILGRMGHVIDFFSPGHIDYYAGKDLGKEGSFKFPKEV